MDSLYDVSNTFNQNILNTGFNYSSTLLRKSLSAYLFQNENLSNFLSYVNDIMVNNTDSIKKVRIHNNYTVKSNTKYIN